MRSLRNRLLGFIRNGSGVAAVEFALVLPVLIVLYFGAVETASLYTVDRRVTVVAGTVGDLVSRVDKTIAQSTLTDYFQAATGIMQPYPTTGLKQVVSVLNISSTGVATVRWSRGYNGGAARNANASFPLAATTEINKLARSGCLVVSEISYPYKPVYGLIISKALTLQHAEYYLPRFEECISIT